MKFKQPPVNLRPVTFRNKLKAPVFSLVEGADQWNWSCVLKGIRREECLYHTGLCCHHIWCPNRIWENKVSLCTICSTRVQDESLPPMQLPRQRESPLFGKVHYKGQGMEGKWNASVENKTGCSVKNQALWEILTFPGKKSHFDVQLHYHTTLQDKVVIK